MPIRRASFEADVELSEFNSSSVGRPRSMAPDKGSPRARDRSQGGEEDDMSDDTASNVSDNDGPDASLLQRDDAQEFLTQQAEQGQHFTIRGVIVGLGIGTLIAMSNMYFGLQVGWISGQVLAIEPFYCNADESFRL